MLFSKLIFVVAGIQLNFGLVKCIWVFLTLKMDDTDDYTRNM